MCLHLSAHGASDGLLFGGHTASWKQLLDAIQPVLSSAYDGPRVLVLSSCDADQQRLTKEITEAVRNDEILIPPRYIFCATGKVAWRDAAVGWTLLYHLIPRVNLDESKQVKEMLAQIKSVDAATFTYFRWDKKTRSYKRYPSKKSDT
jgi:hypothetical protein